MNEKYFKPSFLVEKKEEYKSKNFEIEYAVLNRLLKKIAKNYAKFKIVENCKDYATMQFNDVDIIRLKYTDKTKWIKIFIPPKYKNNYINNILFEEQQNKNQLHWKSSFLNEDDLDKYIDIIKKGIKFLEK